MIRWVDFVQVDIIDVFAALMRPQMFASVYKDATG